MKVNKDIKNIIFDLGNVILNIDTKLSEIEFAKHGLSNFGELYTLASQSEIFDRLEIGAMSPDDFYCEFRTITKSNLSDEVIRNCWNALILDFPPKRIELLKSLKSQYRTFILSNTNQIHYDFYTNLLKEQFQINGLEALVEKAYFSHEIGLKKPFRHIYDFIISKSDLNPNETLFIDDNKDNILAAEKLGIKTIWLKDNNLESIEICKK
jgi:putative hydrolase of the HAD superfamily